MSESIPVMIVPTLTGHDRLHDLFDSIDYPVDHAVIINNNAKRFVNVYSNFVEQVSVVTLPSNLGVAASWNLGIKVTPMSAWWLIVNDDVTFNPGSLAKFADEVDLYGDMVIANSMSPWCCFALTEKVVDIVGLFDEAFYPAYFEDTDYARRVRHYLGEDTISSPDITVNHRNSSTIGDGYAEQNQRTYHENYRTFEEKLSLNRYEPIGWSLAIRRANDWGQP